MTDIEIVEDASDADIAQFLEEFLSRRLRQDDAPLAISVPGGSTPFPILAELAGAQFDWSRITVWPGDDRVVPESHEASNAGRIRALLEPVGAEVVSLTVMEQVPHFALTWLGMGGDGHIASLFPNTDPQVDDPQTIRRLTPDPLPPEAPFDRVTLTIPALVDADALMFVIRGAEKRAVFDSAVRGEHDLPVARLLDAVQRRGGPRVTCFT